jgi:phenylalanyl-tRNA synthetase alpha chain
MAKGKMISLKPEYISVLKTLQELNRAVEARELCDITHLEYEKLMSGAIYTLQQEGLATFTEEPTTILQLSEEGMDYKKNGLPERKLYNLFTANGRREASITELEKEAEQKLKLDKKLFFVALSNMKKKKWVVSSKATGTEQILIYDEKPAKQDDEKFLDLFDTNGTLKLSDVPKDLYDIEDQMYKRKLFTRNKMTLRIISLTAQGKAIKDSQITELKEELVRITPEMLKTGTWKESLSQLKKYNVSADAPRINAGKLHPMTIIINEIREIFHSMGFTEIRGPVVESAFYNFDSLYQPQDHPAREMHDTFYLKSPAKAKLPDKASVEAIKNTHENGGESGSTGWKYEWKEDIAKKLLLRTHTTATTLRRLSTVMKEKDVKFPLKVFCIDRVFRNEKVDRTHLAEFQQIEGIVIGENVTLCDLIGQIVEFYKRMGFKKVVTRPAFFPYTEPSMEIAVYSEALGKWLEMGGSGIFRPEVTYPWGIKNPMRVLAWGMGLERLAMMKLKRADIRDLYQSPISWLREVQY